jgi:hypothetical protein
MQVYSLSDGPRVAALGVSRLVLDTAAKNNSRGSPSHKCRPPPSCDPGRKRASRPRADFETTTWPFTLCNSLSPRNLPRVRTANSCYGLPSTHCPRYGQTGSMSTALSLSYQLHYTSCDILRLKRRSEGFPSFYIAVRVGRPLIRNPGRKREQADPRQTRYHDLVFQTS